MKKPTLTKLVRLIFQAALIVAMLAGCGVIAPPSPTATTVPPTFTATLPPTSTFTPLPPTATPSPTATPKPAIERVLIISIDGLRPDAMLMVPTPNLTALMQAGAYTLNAQTVHPSATLPAHASMLTGLCPDQHGVNWNDYIPENGYAQGTSIFTQAKQAGLYTIMIVNKEKLRQVTPPESTDVFLYVNDRDTIIAEQAAPILEKGFDLAFVHFATTDAMGHVHGWLSPEQLSVIGRADEAIGTLLTALDEGGLRESTLIIVVADHGGHDDLHGTWLPQDMTIPWIISGPGVIPQTITEPVNVTDTAATAAWALNLPSLPDAAGAPILEAFGKTPTTRADLRCP
jgi:predicted AlkP superfamily pyrophosphatase or phosphodiesterase